MRPIDSLTAGDARGVKFVLFDIDDTITEDGRLLKESYDAIWSLERSGIAAIPVTGRPAGWCDLIARQWPVGGVIGENGAFAFYMDGDRLESLFHGSAPDPEAVRVRLSSLGRDALESFPGLRLAKDQPYRIFDVALDFAEEEPRYGLDFAVRVKAFCEARGAVAKVSSIHVNAWFGAYDKLSMAELFLTKRFDYDPSIDRAAVMYFGDSPNDEPMFGHFPLSCGVANVGQYSALLTRPPKFVTKRPFGYGFAEGVDVLLRLRENR
ncbi:MAG: HAD-IIB family hydrolase [Spirochaetes bacterium]|nr:HAD-IIB family hydrolase [Spirochaetota bacterium]MBU1081816.1 HAD-IIB family hydrolase [Spirochaetota bacterium]